MRQTGKKYTKKIEKQEYWKAPKKPRLMPCLKGHDQTAYFHYRKHRKTNLEIGEDRTLYSKTVAAIFKAMAQTIVEYEGGLFLKDYGLFTGMVLPWLDKGVNFKNSKDLYFHTDGYNYCLQFFPDVTKGSCLANMNMDRTFDYRVKRGFNKALIAGFKPKLYYSSLKSVHSRKPHKKD